MLGKMLWGVFFGVVIKMWVWIFKQFFELIKLIFQGVGYLIGLIWSGIFSREKEPKQETHERVDTENIARCTECGSIDPSSLMTVCPDCGALLCSDCREHHNCIVKVNSHSYEGGADIYGEVGGTTASYDVNPTVHNTQPIKKKGKGTGERRAVILVVLLLVFIFLISVIGWLSPLLYGIICLFIFITDKVSSKGLKISGAVVLTLLIFMLMGIQTFDGSNFSYLLPSIIGMPIVIGVCLYTIYSCLDSKRRDTQLHQGIEKHVSEQQSTCFESSSLNEESDDDSNSDFVTCTGCGEQHPKSSMRKCHTCGAVLCPSCRKHHTCGEEMVECMGCGERYPKSSMRKCHTCGDVLCPSCRKHHICGSSKNESLDTFTESELQKPSANVMKADETPEPSVTSFIPEVPSDDAKEWFKTGMMYYEGDGVEKDTEQAVYWYIKSAEAGYIMAQAFLGLHHLNTGNFADASHWLRKADDGGLVLSDIQPDIMHTIANAFAKGDYDAEALYWYTRGAEQGNAECQYMLGLQYLVNLIVGYKRYMDELAATSRERERLQEEIAHLREAQKTPADRLKEMEDKLAALNNDSGEF